LVVILVTTSV
ncbi:fumarate and nitrate reduction regulatory protein, partial [Vibrio harveyi]